MFNIYCVYFDKCHYILHLDYEGECEKLKVYITMAIFGLFDGVRNVLLMQEEDVLKDQELKNAVLDANYTKAIHLAFELRRPHKLFELFGTLCRLTQE